MGMWQKSECKFEPYGKQVTLACAPPYRRGAGREYSICVGADTPGRRKTGSEASGGRGTTPTSKAFCVTSLFINFLMGDTGINTESTSSGYSKNSAS